jgi:hypothetical protein
VLLVIEMTGRLAPALLVGALFAFATAMWSVVSRGLWQHGPLILIETVALILLTRGRNRGDWRWSAAAGLPLGAAYVVRPTASIPIILVGLYLLFVSRRTAALYAVAVAAVVVPSIAYNEHIYGTALNPFYFHNGSGFLGAGLRDTFLTGLAGTAVSPARGLLVYSPFLLLALVGLVWPRRRRAALDYVALAVVVLTWLVTANTMDWAGGWSYGPRLLSDTFPWLALLFIPVADALTSSRTTWTRFTRVSLAVLAVTAAWSIFVNARGALSWSTQLWNSRPIAAGVDTHPGRFWDWGDPACLRAGRTTIKDLYPPQSLPPLGRQCEAT